MAVAQGFGILTLLSNPFAQVNHYHATYLGSYLLLDAAQIEREGVPAADLSCVGVDAWGIRMVGKERLDAIYNQPTCYDHRPIGIVGVLRPLLRHPALLFRMLAWSMPIHFTVKYFHIVKANRYLRPPTQAGFGVGRILIAARDLREQVVTRAAPVILILALCFAVFRLWRGGDVAIPGIALFLSLLFVSQVVVALLGEGFRDLSKHMDGAQLSLDFLVMFTLIDAALYGRSRAGAGAALPR